MITINNLNKSFGDNQVLKNVSLEIKQGEKIVIMGPSGCGKSTLLRILAKLENYQSGDIHIDNQVLSRVKPITQKLSMVFQSFNLFPHMSVLDNLIFSPVKIHKQNKEASIIRANQLLKTLSLQDQVDQYPATLSGGQKQRVAIARSLMLDPPILLFDEPTSSLDPEMSTEVLKSLDTLASSNKSILCVTHEMDFAKKFADKIAFFDNGELVAFESTERFLSNPNNKIQSFLDVL